MQKLSFLVCAVATACVSHGPPAAVVAEEAPAEAPPPPPRSPVAVALDKPYDDPGELNDPTVMTPLFDRNARPSFPKATTTDRACWQTVSLSGDANRDFTSLVASCGAPTGSVQYVTPARGKLHSIHDKRDTFLVKIQGGLCYRFFGVADSTIANLDILIERKNGDLVGDDRTNGPVAIIESDKNWCMDDDGEYQFKVQVEGPGTGNYEFGVWARPKM